ncbi:MAG: hypothetical protein AB7T37_03320 [Dehalococcoidia bacterium]
MTNHEPRLDDWSDRVLDTLHRAGALVLGAAAAIVVIGYTWSFLR